MVHFHSIAAETSNLIQGSTDELRAQSHHRVQQRYYWKKLDEYQFYKHELDTLRSQMGFSLAK